MSYYITISVDLLGRLEDCTIFAYEFNPDEWSNKDIVRLEKILAFIEKKKKEAVKVNHDNVLEFKAREDKQWK